MTLSLSPSPGGEGPTSSVVQTVESTVITHNTMFQKQFKFKSDNYFPVYVDVGGDCASLNFALGGPNRAGGVNAGTVVGGAANRQWSIK